MAGDTALQHQRPWQRQHQGRRECFGRILIQTNAHFEPVCIETRHDARPDAIPDQSDPQLVPDRSPMDAEHVL